MFYIPIPVPLRTLSNKIESARWGDNLIGTFYEQSVQGKKFEYLLDQEPINLTFFDNTNVDSLSYQPVNVHLTSHKNRSVIILENDTYYQALLLDGRIDNLLTKKIVTQYTRSNRGICELQFESVLLPGHHRISITASYQSRNEFEMARLESTNISDLTKLISTPTPLSTIFNQYLSSHAAAHQTISQIESEMASQTNKRRPKTRLQESHRKKSKLSDTSVAEEIEEEILPMPDDETPSLRADPNANQKNQLDSPEFAHEHLTAEVQFDASTSSFSNPQSLYPEKNRGFTKTAIDILKDSLHGTLFTKEQEGRIFHALNQAKNIYAHMQAILVLDYLTNLHLNSTDKSTESNHGIVLGHIENALQSNTLIQYRFFMWLDDIVADSDTNGTEDELSTPASQQKEISNKERISAYLKNLYSQRSHVASHWNLEEALKNPSRYEVYFNTLSSIPFNPAAQELLVKESISHHANLITNDHNNTQQKHLLGSIVHLYQLSKATYTRARDIIFEYNQRLVLSIAKRYSNHGLDYIELIQEGNTGMLRAISGFQHERGLKFGTYASWWIRQGITRAIADKGRLIRVPVHIKDKTKKYYTFLRSYYEEHGQNPTPEEVMNGIDISKRQYDALSAKNPLSLQSIIGEDGAEFSEIIDATNQELDGFGRVRRPDEGVAFGNKLHLTTLLEHSSLTDREKEVIRMRFADELTLEEIGNRFDVTRERIRQIEEKAKEKLRKQLNHNHQGEY